MSLSRKGFIFKLNSRRSGGTIDVSIDLFDHTGRKLIDFRNTSSALTYGNIDHSSIHIEEVVNFIRSYENEQLLVLHNVSDVEVMVKLENGNARFNEIDYVNGAGKIALNGGELRLPAYTTVILKRD